MALKPETRDRLRKVSTATLATALFKRGFRTQFVQGVRPLSPQRLLIPSSRGSRMPRAAAPS